MAANTAFNGFPVLGSILAIVYTAKVGPIEGITAVGIANAEESLSRALEIAERMSVTVAQPLIETAKLAFLSGYHTAIAVAIALVGMSSVIAAVVLRLRDGTI